MINICIPQTDKLAETNTRKFHKTKLHFKTKGNLKLCFIAFFWREDAFLVCVYAYV